MVLRKVTVLSARATLCCSDPAQRTGQRRELAKTKGMSWLHLAPLLPLLFVPLHTAMVTYFFSIHSERAARYSAIGISIISGILASIALAQMAFFASLIPPLAALAAGQGTPIPTPGDSDKLIVAGIFIATSLLLSALLYLGIWLNTRALDPFTRVKYAFRAFLGSAIGVVMCTPVVFAAFKWLVIYRNAISLYFD